MFFHLVLVDVIGMGVLKVAIILSYNEQNVCESISMSTLNRNRLLMMILMSC